MSAVWASIFRSRGEPDGRTAPVGFDLFSIIFFGSYGGLTHPGNLFFHAEKAFARNGRGHVLILTVQPRHWVRVMHSWRPRVLGPKMFGRLGDPQALPPTKTRALVCIEPS